MSRRCASVEFSTRKVRTYQLFPVVFLTLAVFAAFAVFVFELVPIPPVLAHNPVQFAKGVDFHVVVRLIVCRNVRLVRRPQFCLPLCCWLAVIRLRALLATHRTHPFAGVSISGRSTRSEAMQPG
jgi:hypothetical protein